MKPLKKIGLYTLGAGVIYGVLTSQWTLFAWSSSLFILLLTFILLDEDTDRS